MPRTGRVLSGGYCYHVLNRGNGRQEVFHKDDDYALFLKSCHKTSRLNSDSPGIRMPIQVL